MLKKKNQQSMVNVIRIANIDLFKNIEFLRTQNNFFFLKIGFKAYFEQVTSNDPTALRMVTFRMDTISLKILSRFFFNTQNIQFETVIDCLKSYHILLNDYVLNQ